MADPQLLPLQSATLPDGFCPSNYQDMLDAFGENLFALLPENLAQIVRSTETPAADDQDKVWLREDDDGNFLRFYIYDGTKWIGPKHASVPGTVVMDCTDYGSEVAAKAGIQLLDEGTDDDPFWVLCDGTESTPDFRGRTPIAAGQGVGLTDRALGVTGGEELHTLLLGELAAHGHTGTAALAGGHRHEIKSLNFTTDAIALWGKTSGGAGTGWFYGQQGQVNGYWPQFFTETIGDHTHDVTVGNTGSDTPHNNMQPYRAIWFRMRTARERYYV